MLKIDLKKYIQFVYIMYYNNVNLAYNKYLIDH